MKQLITLLILCYSLSASAYYPTYVSKTDHLIALSNHSSGTWNSITLNNASAGKPIHDEIKNIYKIINRELFLLAEQAMKDGLSGTSLADFKRLEYADMVGKLETKIITQSNGIISVEVGGFYLNVRAQLDGIIGFAKADAKVSTSQLRFAADYDVITGRIYNLRDIGNMQVYHDLSASGIIDNIVVGIVEVLEDIFFADAFEEMVDDALNKLIGTEYYIGGVDSVIEEGIWIIDGVDVGIKIKEAIKGVNADKYIVLALSEWDERYYEGSKYRYYYRNRLEIDISNEFTFDYGNSPVYAIGDWINPCAGPGGSSSGCYEP